MMRGSALLAAFVAFGLSCVRPDVVECGDTICPLGAQCLAAEARCVDPTKLEVDKSELVFDVPCGSPSQDTITLRNHGATPIAFTARSTQLSIQPSPSEGVVEPGGTFELVITADPGATSIPGSEVDGVITIATTSGSNAVGVEMTSNGAIATISGTLDFGETAISVAKQRVIKIRNDGTTQLTAAITNPPEPVTNIVDFAQTILPGAEASFPFHFQSPGVGEYGGSATLELQGELCQPAPTQLEVHATVSGAALLVDATHIELAPIDCDAGARDSILALTNNTAQPQNVMITNSDDSMFTTVSSVTIPPLATSAITIVRRATSRNDEPGDHVTTLTLVGEITRTVEIVQPIVAPKLMARPSSLNLTGTTRAGTLLVSNVGNAIAVGTLDPSHSHSITASPTNFQIPAGGTVSITFEGEAGDVPKDDLLTRIRTARGACGGEVGLRIHYDPHAEDQ